MGGATYVLRFYFVICAWFNRKLIFHFCLLTCNVLDLLFRDHIIDLMMAAKDVKMTM